MLMLLFLSTVVGCTILLFILRRIRANRDISIHNNKNGGNFNGESNEEVNGIAYEDICEKEEEEIYYKFSDKNGGESEDYENKNNDDELLAIRLRIFIDYLDYTYWKYRESAGSVGNMAYTRDNLKPVLRIANSSRRKIHIVYSKNTLWKLAFSENLQSGLNEKFAFIFKGLKSWSVDETRGRFADVMKDLLEFRQDIYQEFIKHLGNSWNTSKMLVPLMKSRPTKIKEPESIIPFYDDPRYHNVVCQRELLHFVDDREPFHWKIEPPRGIERKIPSVCFVIPFRETEVPGLTNGIEIQYKHLLTVWNGEKPWDVEQPVTSSEVMSLLKVLKPIPSENGSVPNSVMEDALDLESNVSEEKYRTFDDLIFPDAIPLPGEFNEKRKEIDEPPCTEQKVTSLEKEPEMKFPGEIPLPERFEENQEVVELPCVAAKPVTVCDKPDISFDLDMDDNTKINDSVNRSEKTSDDLLTEVDCISSIEDMLINLDSILLTLNTNNKIAVDEYSIYQDILRLQNIRNDMFSRIYPEYRNLTIQASQSESDEIQKKIKLLVERWKLAIYKLNECDDRLNNADVVIIIANELDEFLNHVEWILISQHGITANFDDVKQQNEQIIELESKFDSFETNIKKLKRIMDNLRDVELSEVNGIIKRWERAFLQMKGRKTTLNDTQNKVLDFREALKAEMQWFEGIYQRLKSEELVSLSFGKDTTDYTRVESLLNEYTELSRELTSHRKPIQDTFYMAEGLILTSKVYENDLKEFSYLVNGCIDESCRYFIADQSREWIASNTLKLSQLYELIITELPQKINILLATINFQTDILKHDRDDGETACVIYNGDNDVSLWELEKLLKWIGNKESELSEGMPSYKSFEELNSYVLKLQDLIHCIDKNEYWVNSTLNSIHNALQEHSSVLTRTTREHIRLKLISVEIRWSKLQWDIEGCNARLIPLQKVLRSYEKVLKPFLAWLQTVENQAKAYNVLSPFFNINKAPFDPNVTDFNNIQDLSSRHERFLSDVTHREIDLQKLNRHGNMLVFLAKGLQIYLCGFPDSMSTGVIGTGQIWDLERSLYEINGRYKTLVRSLTFYGELINELVHKHKYFSQKVDIYIPWLTVTEREVMKLHTDDDEISLEQIILNKGVISRIHGDVNNHYDDLVLIKMASDDLSSFHKSDSKGRIYGDGIQSGVHLDGAITHATTAGMWINTMESIFNRYRDLSTNIVNLENQLQFVYVTKQDKSYIVSELLQWIDETNISLSNTDSTCDKSFLLQQIRLVKRISSEADVRQQSVESLVKDVEPNATDINFGKTLLNILQRIIDIRLCVVGKRELCFTTYIKNVNSFAKWLTDISNHLKSINIVGVDIVLFEKEVMTTIENLERQRETFELINQCGSELLSLDSDDQMISKLLRKLNELWQSVTVELINKRAELNELLGFIHIYHETFRPLSQWLAKMEECIKNLTPVSIHPQVLADQLMEQNVFVNDAYSYESTVQIHTDMTESTLYDIYCKYTTENLKEPTPIEIEIRSIKDRYERIVSVLEHRGVYLNLTYSRLEEYNIACDKLANWFQHVAHVQIMGKQIAEDLDEILRQYVDFQRYDEDLERITSNVQHTLRLGRELVAGKSEIDGAPIVKRQNDKIKLRWDVIKKSSSKYHRAIESSLEKTFYKRQQNVLSSIKMICKEAKDITVAKDEKVILKSVRDLCHDISLYEPALTTLHQAADLLIKCTKTDHGQVNQMINELDESCRELDFILSSKQFDGKIHLNGPLEISRRKDVPETINHSIKHDQKEPEQNVSPSTSHVTQDKPKSRPSRGWSRHTDNIESMDQLRVYPEQYTSFKSTVERHTRVSRSHVCNKLHRMSRLVDYLNDPCATFDKEDGNISDDMVDHVYTMPTSMTEKIITTADGSNIRKITSTDVRREERRILRRRYVDDNGNQCVEEIEVPGGELDENILDEQRHVDDGAVILKSPDENQTTTEEEFVRDDAGNVIKWIIKKRIRRTKCTRVIKRITGDEVDIDAHSQISVVPSKQEEDADTVPSYKLLDSINKDGEHSSMSIPLDKLIELYNSRKNYVTSVTKHHISIPDKRYKAIVNASRLLGDIPEEEKLTTMRINPHLIHKLFVSRVVPSFDPIDRPMIVDIGRNADGEPNHSVKQDHVFVQGEPVKFSANISNVHLENEHQNKYYQDIKLKCIKSPENEETHVCPEHNVIEEEIIENGNGHDDAKLNHLSELNTTVNSKRKGFRMIIQTSDERDIVYEGNTRSHVHIKPQSRGRLVVKDITMSPVNNHATKYDINKNVTQNGGDETKQPNENGHSHPDISFELNDENLQEDSRIKVRSQKSQVETSLKQTFTPNFSQKNPVISITVDDDGKHDVCEGGQYKRLKKITVTPSESNTNDKTWNATVRLKSTNVQAVILRHPNDVSCHRETVSQKDMCNGKVDSPHEAEARNEFVVVDDNGTCTNQVSSPVNGSPKHFTVINGGEDIRETVSHTKSSKVITRTESTADKNKTVVHITVKSETDKEAE